MSSQRRHLRRQRLSRPPERRAVILKVGPRDFSVLAWVRDEAGEPVYRVVKYKIKAAKIAATPARKLQENTR